MLLAGALASLLSFGIGCGQRDSDSTNATPPANGEVTGSLSFTRSDGTRFSLNGAEVRCGPSSTERKRPAIFVRSRSPSRSKPFFQLEAVVADVMHDPVVQMPSNYIESNPHGAVLYAFDPKTGNELDSTYEDSSGAIRFESVSCDPRPRIAFTVDGTLDSEFENLDPAAVKGSFSSD